LSSPKIPPTSSLALLFAHLAELLFIQFRTVRVMVILESTAFKAGNVYVVYGFIHERNLAPWEPFVKPERGQPWPPSRPELLAV
jgi:hypothetical protein